MTNLDEERQAAYSSLRDALAEYEKVLKENRDLERITFWQRQAMSLCNLLDQLDRKAKVIA